jgi:uncharacterized Zn-binding protein involved in type VI secretion
MPASVRQGDSSQSHDTWTSRPNDQGSPNVFVNDKPVHRVGDHWITHCNSKNQCHDGVAAPNGRNVYANGKARTAIGDPISCGDTMKTGSSNVFIND